MFFEWRVANFDFQRSFVLRSWDIRERCMQFIATLDLAATKTPFEVLVKPLRLKRTVAQNRRYWAILRDISEQWYSAEGYRYTQSQLHEEFKRLYLGSEDEWVGFDGMVRSVPISTTILSTKEFNEYMEMVEAWAADAGVVLSDEAKWRFKTVA